MRTQTSVSPGNQSIFGQSFRYMNHLCTFVPDELVHSNKFEQKLQENNKLEESEISLMKQFLENIKDPDFSMMVEILEIERAKIK